MTDRFRHPHANDSAAGAPGASGPGDPAYDGNVTVGADAEPGPTETPFGQPGWEDEISDEVRLRAAATDRLVEEQENGSQNH